MKSNLEQLKNLLFKNGKLNLNNRCIEKSWYENRKITHLYDFIFSETSFLNKYNSTIFERLYYIINNLKSEILCKYCMSNKVRIINGISNGKFLDHCDNIECKYKFKSDYIKNYYLNMSEERKLIKNKKISQANRGRKFSEEARKNMSIAQIGKKQSKQQSQKRIETRKNNKKPWNTLESNKKSSESNKRFWNSEEGKKVTQLSNKIMAPKISKIMKNKITNGEFTPNITNSWTHFDSYIIKNDKRIKFRSNWEAAFFLLNDNKKLEFEKIRIKYFDSKNNKERNYIVDFVDDNEKILYEIKPNSRIDIEIDKINSAKIWCKKNNYSFIIINEEWFKDNAKNINFDQHPQLLKSMKQFL